MNSLSDLLSNRAVLVAAWALARALLSWAAPSIPPQIIAAVDSLAAAVIASIAVSDVKRNADMLRAMAEADANPGKEIEYNGMLISRSEDDEGGAG